MRLSTTTCRRVRRKGLAFRPAAGRHGKPVSAPSCHPYELTHGVGGATRCVTPRQTCPQPNGFGRNLRSKTRWFTGFCNSHQVSQFATFFIDARAEISVAESRFCFFRCLLPSRALRGRSVERQAIPFLFSLALLYARGCLCARRATYGRRRAWGAGPGFPSSQTPVVLNMFSGRLLRRIRQ